MSEADWAESREHIADALRAGWKVLAADGSAVDAVQATVMVLEDSPHFNAGHGAALTEASTHELDASIMDGATLAAGAVAGVRRIRNPVAAARAIMESGRAVLLIGEAAEAFAAARGATMVEPSYFTTSAASTRWRACRRGRRPARSPRPPRPRSTAPSARSPATGAAISPPPPRPAASTTSPWAVSATARSSGRGPTRRTASAPSPARGRARSSSASRRRMSSPPASASAGRPAGGEPRSRRQRARQLRHRRGHDLPRRRGRALRALQHARDVSRLDRHDRRDDGRHA